MAERAEMDKVQKHILIFSTAYLPLVGGAELAVKEITDRLPECRFSLVTARLKRGLAKREKIGQVEVFRLGLGWSLDKFLLAILGPFWASWRFKNDPPAMVWGIMASFGGLAAVAYKKRTGRPFLLTLQEGDNLTEIEKKSRILAGWFKQIFTRADAIQAISTYLKDWALKMGAACPIEVVPNGAEKCDANIRIHSNDTKGKDGDSKIFDRAPNTYNLTPVLIITTSRLVKKNGVDDLIRALKFLPGNFNLKIVGIGSDEAKLKKLVSDLGLDARVVFVGFVSPEKIFEELATAAVFVRASRSEGLGNSFLEAMSVGLPVVGTPVGGIPDFLKEGETGWFCEPNNPESIAEKIKLIADPANRELIEKVTDKARCLVEEKYNWEIIAVEMSKIFEKLTAKKN